MGLPTCSKAKPSFKQRVQLWRWGRPATKSCKHIVTTLRRFCRVQQSLCPCQATYRTDFYNQAALHLALGSPPVMPPSPKVTVTVQRLCYNPHMGCMKQRALNTPQSWRKDTLCRGRSSTSPLLPVPWVFSQGRCRYQKQCSYSGLGLSKSLFHTKNAQPLAHGPWKPLGRKPQALKRCKREI